MEIFAYILIFTVLLLLGNLARLLYCTVLNFRRSECKKERTQGIALFIMYLLTTAFFSYFAIRTICSILCDHAPIW